MPAVRLGIGAELEGEIQLVQGELAVEGRISIDPVLGWECGGTIAACRGLDTLTPNDNFKTRSKIPSVGDAPMHAKVSAHFYVVAGLDASILLGAANASIVEARVGPKQSFDLAFEKEQALRPDYAASYDLKLAGVIEPGDALKEAIKKVIDDDATTVKFKAEAERALAESPKGTLSVSKNRIRPGEAVDFSVALDQQTVAYWQLGYNVTGVELHRRKADESSFTLWKSMTLTASNQANYRWVPEIGDLGDHEFAAFVNTQVLTPLLEVAPSSVKAVAVSCFGATALATGSDRQTRQSVSSGARIASLPATCADTWVGTAATGSIPGGPNHTEATLTLKFNDRITGSGPDQVFYYAEGTVKVKLGPGWPAGCTISPTQIAITRETGGPGSSLESNQFVVDYSTTPPTVGGGGQVSALTTISCPSSTSTSMTAHTFAHIPAGTPLSADGSSFEGTNPPFFTFSFRRP
jgi:hypothetical protein